MQFAAAQTAIGCISMRGRVCGPAAPLCALSVAFVDNDACTAVHAEAAVCWGWFASLAMR